MIKEADIDGDGELSFDDFMQPPAQLGPAWKHPYSVPYSALLRATCVSRCVCVVRSSRFIQMKGLGGR